MSERSERRGPLLSLEELNRIVLEFLNKKGYSRTEAMLRLESSGTMTPSEGAPASTGVASGSMPLPPPVVRPDMYARSYVALRDWVDSSLDLYQPELRRILYPVFVYMFLDLVTHGHTNSAHEFFDQFSKDHTVFHEGQLQKIGGIRLPQHVKENEVAQQFLQKKYRVILSRTSFDLMLFFLHDTENLGGSIIIRIINQHIEVSVSKHQPGSLAAGLLPGEGIGGSAIDGINSRPVRLGRLPMDPEFRQEVQAMLEQQDKDEPSQDGVKLADIFAESTKPESDSPAADLLPLPKYRPVDVDEEIAKVVDMRNRIQLGGTQASLPSVCMYTFHNTHDDLNCVKFSPEGALVAGGFADSYVQIWSLNKNKKLGSMLKGSVPEYSRRLIGHSGAVYGLSFAPDQRSLLSCSEDHTIRLWSLNTYTALVAYKCHTDPVWDVEFGPFGHYFASASHDQTALLWSCDHVYPLRVFSGHMSDVDNIAFHPNGTYLFTGSSDKTIRMWDINKGSAVRVFIGHVGAVTAIAVSPDGRWLASAGEDAIINIWDIGSGTRLKSMTGHGKASIYSLSFTMEGSVLVSGGADYSVRTWDVKKNTSEDGPTPEAIDQPTVSGPRRREIVATPDHLAVFRTKCTPVYNVQFTRRNLVLAAGAFLG